MKVTVLQPPYFAGSEPDLKIAEFLTEKMSVVHPNSLMVLPEYSNAGGISDPDAELKAMPRAKQMLEAASVQAKEHGAYISINVLEERDGHRKNSTYLFDKNGDVAFVYDKVHLPPSELALRIVPGNGDCTCVVDGIRFGFLTCYDVYFNEQIEYLASQKPDVILAPSYQRGERADMIQAQMKIIAFRTNAYVVRASFSMDSDEFGGHSMIVAPDGKIIADMGKKPGSTTVSVDIKWKHMRPAGFGGGLVRNDDFINMGLCPQVFHKESTVCKIE